MADLLVLVEDVSSDNKLLCDIQPFCFRVFCRVIYDKLKALYDDHCESSIQRINQFIATPPRTSHPAINTANVIDDLD